MYAVVVMKAGVRLRTEDKFVRPHKEFMASCLDAEMLAVKLNRAADVKVVNGVPYAENHQEFFEVVEQEWIDGKEMLDGA